MDELPLGLALRLGLDALALGDLDGAGLLVLAPLFYSQQLPFLPRQVMAHAALTSSSEQ